MNKLGSILAIFGGAAVVLIGLASLLLKDLQLIWRYEFSSDIGFFYAAGVLAFMIGLLGFLSFNTRPRLLGAIIIGASFAGVIVGSTLTDIAMLFSICGGFILYIQPEKPKVADAPVKPKPKKQRKSAEVK